MAGVRADLARLAFLANKGVRIIDAAAQTSILVDPADPDGDTRVVFTPGQKQAILVKLDPVLTEIHEIDAGLP